MSTNKRAPWNEAENLALVALYFRMLDGFQRTENLNKAMLIRMANGTQTATDRALRPSHCGEFRDKLAARSRGSIEAKLMNASATHRDLINEHIETFKQEPLGGRETMAVHGYKAWGNYQADLKLAMQVAIDRRAMDVDGYRAIR